MSTNPIRKEVRIGACRLILGDCLKVMPTLSCVDHVISDPPYEKEAHRADREVRRGGRLVKDPLTFASIGERRDPVSRSCAALSKGWIIVFCQAEGVRLWVDSLAAAGARPRNPMVWVKPDASPRFSGDGPAMGYESLVTAWVGKGGSKWNGGGRRGVFTFPRDEGKKRLHQTQKPIRLMCELVSLFTGEGQHILDPFMGSGTTGVACARLGRAFTGIEVDEGYFEAACERVSQAYQQPDMFVQPTGMTESVQEVMGL